MDSINPAAAMYLVGHGSFGCPRLIELQYRRIARYRESLEGNSGPPLDVFTDLNLPRGSSGPERPEELPALVSLGEGIRSNKYKLVFIDLQDGASFNPSALTFVRPYLESAGAKVMNAFYDDGRFLEQSLKRRCGRGAMVDHVTDASDMVCFFPGLASEIIATALRKELDDAVSQMVRMRISERIDALKALKSYAAGRIPFIEGRLSSEWHKLK
jgi:hypothetical protein